MDENELLETLRALLDPMGDINLSDEQLESIALHWTGSTLKEICGQVNGHIAEPGLTNQDP